MTESLYRIDQLTDPQRRLLLHRLGKTAATRFGEPRLVGCVVPQSDTDGTAQELRNFLSERLPGYMIPTGWIFLDAFPLTSRGKVDRQALKSLAGRIHKPEATSVPLQTDTERAIADIWKEVLGLRSVSRHDNFFDLGGHSLLLGKVLTRVRSLGTRSLVTMDLFQYPTVQTLASYVAGDGALREDRDPLVQAEQTKQVKERHVAGAQRLKRQREQRRTMTRGI